MRFLLQALALVAVLAVVTLITLAGGAPNLGTALGFGQMAFLLALMGVMLRS